jgi:hypothetical protein
MPLIERRVLEMTPDERHRELMEINRTLMGFGNSPTEEETRQLLEMSERIFPPSRSIN